jgi:rod shape determining protein RodA
MRKDQGIKNKADWILITLYFSMVIFGIANIHSASNASFDVSIFDISHNTGKQIMWLGFSLFTGLIILIADVRILKSSVYIFYVIVCAMLFAVLFMPPINGQKSWFGAGGFGIQPAEFAKISTALVMADFIARVNIRLQTIRDVVIANFIILIPGVFIALQPDAGTLVVFTSFLFVMYREGLTYDPLIVRVINSFPGVRISQTWIGSNFIPILLVIVVISLVTLSIRESEIILPFTMVPLGGKYIIVTILILIFFLFYTIIRRFAQKRDKTKLIALGAVSAILLSVLVLGVDFGFENLKQHQKDRIELALGLLEDPHGRDYNRYRAMSAVGSGGLNGKGYHNATVASPVLNHVPEQETDFIFCTLSEEWGFLGSFGLIVVFSAFLLRIIVIAERQKTTFSRVYAYSVGMVLFYHFAINVGMNIGLAPVIGIPLPFFSYGGSSLLSFSIMFFILLKLDSERLNMLGSTQKISIE